MHLLQKLDSGSRFENAANEMNQTFPDDINAFGDGVCERNYLRFGLMIKRLSREDVQKIVEFCRTLREHHA